MKSFVSLCESGKGKERKGKSKMEGWALEVLAVGWVRGHGLRVAVMWR